MRCNVWKSSVTNSLPQTKLSVSHGLRNAGFPTMDHVMMCMLSLFATVSVKSLFSEFTSVCLAIHLDIVFEWKTNGQINRITKTKIKLAENTCNKHIESTVLC